MQASATNTVRNPSIDRQLRLRVGIPRQARSARIGPPAAPDNPLVLLNLGGTTVEIAVDVVTATVVVTVVVPEPRETVEFSAEQVGRSDSAGKADASEQEIVIVPEKPLTLSTVIVELAVDPGATALGVVADSVNVDCVAMTAAVPVVAAYAASPL
jgi:hypothetical protein